jgi:hypothetical protein
MHAVMRRGVVTAATSTRVVMMMATATCACVSASVCPVIVVEAGGVVQIIC